MGCFPLSRSVMIGHRPRHLQVCCGSGVVCIPKPSATGIEFSRIGGYEEEGRCCICRDPFAESEAVFVHGWPIEKVVGCAPAQALRAEVGESHLDAGGG